MTGIDVAARISMTEGPLHALVLDGRRTGILFSEHGGAERFGAILASAEGAHVAVETVERPDLASFLHELAWRDADVMVDPEYVVGTGPVAATTSAYVAGTLLRRRLVPA